jgi:hypothetical protein
VGLRGGDFCLSCRCPPRFHQPSAWTFFCLAYVSFWLGTFLTSVRLLFDRTFVRLAFVSLLLGVSMAGNSTQRSSLMFTTHKVRNGLPFVVGIASKITTFIMNGRPTSRTLRVARGGWSVRSVMHAKSFGGAITVQPAWWYLGFTSNDDEPRLTTKKCYALP